MAFKMKYKNLKEVVKGLRSAVEMHGKQADTIEKHIEDMEDSALNFKGANSKNSKCWPGCKKVGTKKSPSGTGETVNDCDCGGKYSKK